MPLIVIVIVLSRLHLRHKLLQLLHNGISYHNQRRLIAVVRLARTFEDCGVGVVPLGPRHQPLAFCLERFSIGVRRSLPNPNSVAGVSSRIRVGAVEPGAAHHLLRELRNL